MCSIPTSIKFSFTMAADHSLQPSPTLTLATSCEHTANPQEMLTWTLKSWAESRQGHTLRLVPTHVKEIVIIYVHILILRYLAKQIMLECILKHTRVLPNLLNAASATACHLLSETNKSTDQSTPNSPLWTTKWCVKLQVIRLELCYTS